MIFLLCVIFQLPGKELPSPMAFDKIYQDLKQWQERRYEASIASINLEDRRILHELWPDMARRILRHKMDGKMTLRKERAKSTNSRRIQFARFRSDDTHNKFCRR